MVKKHKQPSKISRDNFIQFSVIAGIIVLVGFFALQSFSPVNSDKLVFAPSTNIYFKAIESPEGYHFSTQSTKGGKVVPSSFGSSPAITVYEGNLVQVHLINEEKNQSGNASTHNLNIDEFNVHTKNLGYFQAEAITFLADKSGTFDYYCSIHPEMKGTITVTKKEQ